MNMTMNSEYMYLVEDVMQSFASAGSVSSLVGILSYVFSSLALYTIAQRREIRKPWLAWIPVVNVWILGSISDQYRYVTSGEVKNKRKVLLTLSIINWLLGVAAVIRIFVALFSVASAAMQGISEQALVQMVMKGLTSGALLALPTLAIAIAILVFEIMALYDVYRSCEPANSVLYLVLSLIPGISQVTQPVFLFLCRNKDEGMPPRQEPVPEITEEF